MGQEDVQTDFIGSKEFSLEIRRDGYSFLAFLGITILFLVVIVKFDSKAPYISENIDIVLFVSFFFLSIGWIHYAATAKCSVILDAKGLSVNIIKTGLGVPRTELSYNWQEVKSYDIFKQKGEFHVLFRLENGNKIDLIDIKARLGIFLNQYFSDKKYVRPTKWDDFR